MTSKGALPKSLSTQKTSERKEEVLKTLISVYGEHLPTEIIKSVAFNARYNFETALALLKEMTKELGYQDVTSRRKKQKQEKTKNGLNRNTGSYQNLSDADVIIESESPFVHAHMQNAASISPSVDEIVSRVAEGHRVLILMRGLPGSGKTYLAQKIVKNAVNMDCQLFIFSTDDFFQRNGRYIYNASSIPVAHEWNQRRVNDHMKRGVSPVVVDNTNTQDWEMFPYVRMALSFGYFLDVVEPLTPWAFNDRDCAKKNVHNVPRDKIKDMKERYERNITGKKLIERLQGRYARAPPVPRNYPPVFRRQTLQPLKNGGTSVGAGESDFSANGGVRDLLSFDDAKPQLSKVPPSVSIDDIFKCDETVNAVVMQAVLSPIRLDAKPKVSALSPTSAGIYPKLDLESWGVKEEDISAWDVVKTVDKPLHKVGLEPLPQRETDRRETESGGAVGARKETSEIGTITKSGCENDPDVKILIPRRRSISTGVPMTKPYVPPKIAMLDKSTMIDDDEISVTRESEEIVMNNDIDGELDQLIGLFPNVSKNSLIDLYKRCNGDVNWMVDLLLDDPKINIPDPPPSPKKTAASPQPAEEVSQEKQVPIAIETEDPELCTVSLIDDAKELLMKYQSFTLESLKIKKQLEESIDISPEYYSPHVQQIKNYKHGKTCASPASSPEEAGPSNPIEISHKSNSSATCSSKSSGAASSNGSRGQYDTDTTDVDESEFEFVDDSNQMVELNLGDNFVDQLESKFGDPNLIYPKGFQPVVQVPVSLARQLHAFYLESIFQQMETQNQVLDTMMKEDMEFAKKLQDRENDLASASDSAAPRSPVVDLKELMDQEMANKVYQQQMDEWRNNLPDNIAYRLTKDKLICKFPTIDKNILVEILHAHDNCYDNTVAALKATGIDEKEGEDEFKSLVSAAEEEEEEGAQARAQEETAKDSDRQEDNLSAQEYRQMAQVHIGKRQELYDKAQKALKAGLTPAAQFYLEQAQKQTKKCELANHRAATAFLQEHSCRLNYASDTLDLHYLYVKEAMAALDIFLDQHIDDLNTSKTASQAVNVMIITGRGKHTDNGKSKIKPAVMKRLKARSLKYAEMNPGLLRVSVKKHSSLTNNLQ